MKRSFFQRHKKLIIFLILLLIAVGIFLFVKSVNRQTGENSADMEDALTTHEITRQTISNYVSMTGTIEANDSQTVYSTLNELEVLSVNVKVGDYVNKGDVVAKLDSSDFEDKLATALTSYELEKDRTALKVAQAERKYTQVIEDMAGGAEDTEKKVREAGTDYGYSQNDRDNAYEDWQDAIEDYEDAKDDYDEAYKKYKKLKKNKDSVKYKGTTYYYDSDQAGENGKTKNDLKTLVDQLETARDSAEDKVTQEKRSYESQIQSLEKSGRQITDANEDVEDKVTEDARKLQEASEELYSTRLDAQNSTDQIRDQIKEYRKNIEKCTIKAPLSGVVTSVKMEVGDETDGDNNVICVINDTSSYKVEGTVDEYDIAKLSEGMSAVIKTESTGDLEMMGKVTFVSPTPESSSNSTNSGTGSSSSTTAAYSVKILIDELDKDVRIGMTAETNILTQTAEDALTVPYECVTQNLDGDYVIYAVQKGKVTDAGESGVTEGGDEAARKGRGGMLGGPAPGGRRHGGGTGQDTGGEVDINQVRSMGREIVVEKLLETDYYTAIASDEIYEGMEVYVATSLSEDTEESFDMDFKME